MTETLQETISRLGDYWSSEGCVLLHPYDMEVGAGTFHWGTTLRSLGSVSWRAAYVQPCRRPTDGRYGENPNRLQHYYQYQVILKPSPRDSRGLYMDSLREIGLDVSKHDIRFFEDDWESPTLGAWGLGWEVWCDGMEVSQFTYFQQVGGIDCRPVSTEITYGLERLAMKIQGCASVYDLQFSRDVTYGDIFKGAERQFSAYNFEHADIDVLLRHFDDAESMCEKLLSCGDNLSLPAYDQCLKASHIFNLLDARGAISVTERQAYILRVRAMSKGCAERYVESTSQADC